MSAHAKLQTAALSLANLNAALALIGNPATVERGFLETGNAWATVKLNDAPMAGADLVVAYLVACHQSGKKATLGAVANHVKMLDGKCVVVGQNLSRFGSRKTGPLAAMAAIVAKEMGA